MVCERRQSRLAVETAPRRPAGHEVPLRGLGPSPRRGTSWRGAPAAAGPSPPRPGRAPSGWMGVSTASPPRLPLAHKLCCAPETLLPIKWGGATMLPTIEDAGVTQLVEYLLPKQAVVGSSPIARSTSAIGRQKTGVLSICSPEDMRSQQPVYCGQGARPMDTAKTLERYLRHHRTAGSGPKTLE
jgi:hypothetical protein